MVHNLVGSPLGEDGIQATIKKMKAGKATDPHSILMELLEALEEYVIDKIASLLKVFYDTIQILLDISKSIFQSTAKETWSSRV